jgi:DNA-binding LacI/PurR family transcriptional regulator
MRQIAEAAAVSVMTVSRALRDSSLVTPALRERIRKIADELGYRPDPEMAKLMKHLRRHHKPSYMATLAAITSVEESRETLELRKTSRSAQERAEALGYRLELYRVKEPAQFNRTLQRTLVNRGIEGVLLLQMTLPCNVDALLDWGKFSAVTASPSIVGHSFPQAGVNYFHNAQLLATRATGLPAYRVCGYGDFLHSHLERV